MTERRDTEQSRLVNFELQTESSESPPRLTGPAGLVKLAQSLQNSPESRNNIESDMSQIQPKMSLSLQRDIGYSLNFLKTHKGRTEQISPVRQVAALQSNSSSQKLLSTEPSSRTVFMKSKSLRPNEGRDSDNQNTDLVSNSLRPGGRFGRRLLVPGERKISAPIDEVQQEINSTDSCINVTDFRSSQQSLPHRKPTDYNQIQAIAERFLDESRSEINNTLQTAENNN